MDDVREEQRKRGAGQPLASQDRASSRHCLWPAGTILGHLQVSLRVPGLLANGHVFPDPGWQRGRRVNKVEEQRSNLQPQIMPRSEDLRVHITRRCSRRITLAFLPFKAKVSEMFMG